MSQAVAMLVGVVIGIGIFKTPALVAANVSSPAEFLGLWIIGGALTIAGGLCYAELGSKHPDVGGEYHYLTRAYGEATGFLFAFGRMTVMQTGALAAVGFAFGDYAERVLPLGSGGPAVYAVLSIVALTCLQLRGTEASGRWQLALTAVTVVALLVVTFAASSIAAPAVSEAGAQGGQTAAGLALVFILLSYGGWNEAAYLSGELREPRRNMARILILGTVVVLVLYLAFNGALLHAFGLDGLRQSKTVLEGPVADVFGPAGTTIVSLAVCAAAISTMNATIFTGARSIYALGRDFPLLAPLGRSAGEAAAPVNALLIQCAIASLLVAGAAGARDGFQALVEYTAPVFWTFLLLIGVSLFLFRRRDGIGDRGGFRVPLYPLTPLVFCGTCAYLIWSSLVYTGMGALIGVGMLAAGVPIYLVGRSRSRLDANTG